MILYVMECMAFQLLFLMIYDLFLKRETFFQWNRAYLLGTYVLSLLLPFVKLSLLGTAIPANYKINTHYLIQLDEIVLTAPGTVQNTNFSWVSILLVTGAVVTFFLLILKFIRIHQLSKKGEIRWFSRYRQVILKNSTAAFSFWDTVYLGDSIDVKEQETILKHELVHIQQKHSLDLLFFELMRIVSWFNPLVYVYQQKLSQLHEFIADAQVSKTHKRENYQMLLSQVFGAAHLSFINQFFKSSLTKKRIIMLQKVKSKNVWKLKYLVLLPLVMGMLVYNSCAKDDKAPVEGTTLNSVVKQGDVITFHVKDMNNLTVAEKAQREVLLDGANAYDSPKTILITDGRNSMKISVGGGKITNMEVNKAGKQLNGNTIGVPFAGIDEPPVFPGCENADNKRSCFNEMIQRHIRKNFRYPEISQENGIQGKVYINFIIQKDGSIGNIKYRGPDKNLEQEALRIIQKLPKMTPGKQKGKAVQVPFFVPITFKLQ